MEEYRTGSHSRYDVQYHFVWAVKYRKPVLRGDVSLRLRDLIREICRSYEIEILEISVSCDHVHFSASSPPTLSPSKIVQAIKDKTARKLPKEYRLLRRQFWGRHLWSRGYFVATSGTVTEEVIREYIRIQSEPRPKGDDNFKIV
ncbi:MAG: IS200/IS605 family transposase [Thermoguttaceae bacterium]|nr:IS200/IS605 family transposase [Thermoguttaceae bacterium]